MTSPCSRWSQPLKTAISNWNGSTCEVYATAVDPPVGHYGVGSHRRPLASISSGLMSSGSSSRALPSSVAASLTC